MPIRRATRRPRRRVPRRKLVKRAAVSKPLRRAITAVVRSQAETKRAAFYQSYNDGTSNTPNIAGAYSAQGWSVQNNQITSNPVDILQVIPPIQQGTDDWERTGNKISVSNLDVKGSVRVKLKLLEKIYADLSGNWETNTATPFENVKVVIYWLQHKTLKSYTSLRNANDFTQLLEAGNGYNVAFKGYPNDAHMPVGSQFYTVLKKKVIKLKYAGLVTPVLPAGAVTPPSLSPPNYAASISNAHTWYADYSVNLTKHCPKNLLFPDDGSSGVAAQNQPTNSSIFMCMGFIDERNPSNTTFVGPPTFPVETLIEQTYVSSLSFKDM